MFIPGLQMSKQFLYFQTASTSQIPALAELVVAQKTPYTLIFPVDKSISKLYLYLVAIRMSLVYSTYR